MKDIGSKAPEGWKEFQELVDPVTPDPAATGSRAHKATYLTLYAEGRLTLDEVADLHEGLGRRMVVAARAKMSRGDKVADGIARMIMAALGVRNGR